MAAVEEADETAPDQPADALVALDVEVDNRQVFRAGMALIWRSMKLRPWGYVISTIGATVNSLAAVAITVLIGRATDEVIEPAFTLDGVARTTVWLSMIAIVITGVIRALGVVGRRWFNAWSNYGTQAIWRRQVTDKYLDVPMEYHHRTPAGRLLAHADSDVEAATRMLMPLGFVTGALSLGIFAVISLLAVNIWLTVVALVLFPLLAVMNRYYSRKVSVLAMDERSKNAAVSSIAHESFDGAMVVKTLGREQAEVDRLDEAARELRDVRIRVGGWRALFEPLIEALPNLGIVVLLGVGSWLIDSDQITTGELVQAMTLFTILSMPVRIVGFLLRELPSSVAALDRVDTVLSEHELDRAGELASLPRGPLSVRFDDASFDYDGTPVISGFDATIAPGESVAIVGSTGVGKSTLGYLVGSLVEPTDGRVLVGDLPLRTIREAELTDAIGLVFQEAFLFAASVRENITLGRPFSDLEIDQVLELVRADKFVAEMPEGLDTVVGERGVTLSGGQRQRIALARALIRRPRVLVLDDATSAVDPTIEAEILAALRSTVDATLLVVAYRLATIQLADRVLYMVDGAVAADAPSSTSSFSI